MLPEGTLDFFDITGLEEVFTPEKEETGKNVLLVTTKLMAVGTCYSAAFAGFLKNS